MGPGAFGAMEVRGSALWALRFEATVVRQLSVVSGPLGKRRRASSFAEATADKEGRAAAVGQKSIEQRAWGRGQRSEIKDIALSLTV